jgi:hypothetical protein
MLKYIKLLPVAFEILRVIKSLVKKAEKEHVSGGQGAFKKAQVERQLVPTISSSIDKVVQAYYKK